MPQLLLEIFSEEIPARMQGQAAKDLQRMAMDRLTEQGLIPSGLIAFAGPRRLTLVAEGLAPAQADRTEERKGPRVGSPDKAMEGFLRSTGLTMDQLTERDGVWFASLHKPGRPTPAIVAEMVEAIVRGFPWPKSMRWGTGTLRWVRPIKRILCAFDGEVVPFAIDGIESGDLTEGHRVMGSRQPFRARHFDEYAEGLHKNFVVLDPAERRQRIVEGARTLCFARNLELVEDEGLLDEVAGLSEWPTPILGDMDPSFLDLPPEVIRTSLRTHQKYFVVRDPATGKLAPHFVTVANIEATDGGRAIAAGNARVLSARLNDARFFWSEDNKPGNFDRWLEKLKGVTFHAKLGTMAERVERITALAREIAPLVGADPDKAAEAAHLAKADLASQMVCEFPELQGVMGGYYATAAGLEPEIAEAVRDHYKPQGPSDAVPAARIAVAVSLADKLDTLVGFFAIGEKPTGSRDPYALRRAALGVMRLVLNHGVRAKLSDIFDSALSFYSRREFSGNLEKFWNALHELDRYKSGDEDSAAWYIAIAHAVRPLSQTQLMKNIMFEPATVAALDGLVSEVDKLKPEELPDVKRFKPSYGWLVSRAGFDLYNFLDWLDVTDLARGDVPHQQYVKHPRMVEEAKESAELVRPRLGIFRSDLLAFLADRLKVLLRDQGKRHDLVDAVFALGDDDLVRIAARVEALDGFLRTDDGANLLAGFKRATNILRAEEKKTPAEAELYGQPVHPALLREPEEQALHAALQQTLPRVASQVDEEAFSEAMASLSTLRAPVDAFFDNVLVNADEPAVRLNRLRLLSQVRAATAKVADFSLVTG